MTVPAAQRPALRKALAVNARGFLCEVAPVHEILALDAGAPATSPSGSVRYVGGELALLAGDVVTSIVVCVIGNFVSGLTASYFGIYDTAGNRLAQTSDQHANTALNATGYVAIPLTAPYTAPSDRAVYGAKLEVYSGTGSTLLSIQHLAPPLSGGYSSFAGLGFKGAGSDTTLPATAILNALAAEAVPWMALR